MRRDITKEHSDPGEIRHVRAESPVEKLSNDPGIYIEIKFAFFIEPDPIIRLDQLQEPVIGLITDSKS